MSSIDSAQEAAVETERPMLLYFTADWCSSCQSMDEHLLSDEKLVSDMNDKFITVRIDRDESGSDELIAKYNLCCLPTFQIINSNGSVVNKIEGSVAYSDFYEFLYIENSKDLSLNNNPSYKVGDFESIHKHTETSNFQSGRVEVTANTYEELKAKSVNAIGVQGSLSDNQIQSRLKNLESEPDGQSNQRIENDSSRPKFVPGRIEVTANTYDEIQRTSVNPTKEQSFTNDSVQIVENEDSSQEESNEKVVESMLDIMKEIETETVAQNYKEEEYIQAGAFRNIHNAENLLASLQNDTENVFLKVEDDNNSNSRKKLFKVVLGPVNDTQERDVITDILSRHGIKGFSILH